MSPRNVTIEQDLAHEASERSDDQMTLTFDDNHLLALVSGEHDRHLALIENRLGVDIMPRGNSVAIHGERASREMARKVLNALYRRAENGLEITDGDVDGAVRMSRSDDRAGLEKAVELKTLRKVITPRSPGQNRYLRALQNKELIFGIGPAGTGKTYLAVAAAAAALTSGQIDRIILSRPAVEAGENLGFLPGDMKEKVDPYLRPLYDALYDVLPESLVTRGLAENTIEIAPLAFMRGRTLSRAFIILDEAQNTTPLQMKMFLTRFGEGSRMVVTGDPTQIDLPVGTQSGLIHANALLEGVEGIAHIRFDESDIVRHPLVTRIVAAYGKEQR